DSAETTVDQLLLLLLRLRLVHRLIDADFSVTRMAAATQFEQLVLEVVELGFCQRLQDRRAGGLHDFAGLARLLADVLVRVVDLVGQQERARLDGVLDPSEALRKRQTSRREAA